MSPRPLPGLERLEGAWVGWLFGYCWKSVISAFWRFLSRHTCMRVFASRWRFHTDVNGKITGWSPMLRTEVIVGGEEWGESRNRRIALCATGNVYVF